MGQPLVSVVVPVRNGAASLGPCLDALQTQTLSRERYEIIVVDDGSTDATASIATWPGIQCCSIPPSGPAAARNHGAQQAQGDLIFFTDADCVPAPDWATNLLARFSDPTIVGAKGVYRTHEQGLVPRFVQLEYLSKYERMAHLATIDFIDTYSAAYRRDVFLANGGFDTSFPTASVEDQEFSFRLARKGYQLVFVPDAIVFHRHDLNLAEYARRKFWIGYWKAFLLRRHPEKTLKDSHTPASQRLQIALLGAAGLALAFSWLSWPVAVAAGVLLLLFVASALPFVNFIRRHDAPVLVLALPLLVVRATALGLGLVAGGVGLRQRPLTRKHALSGWQRFVKRSLDLVGAALAGALAVAKVAKRTRIHRTQHLKMGRVIDMARAARDRDTSAFQRLAHHLEHAPVEFGELIEEQDSAVGERDLSRHRIVATAHQRGRAGRVMRRAEHPRGPALRGELPDQAEHGRRFECLVGAHRRQQSGEALGQHRLAGAGRTDHQHAVTAGSCDLQSSLGGRLTLDVKKIGIRGRCQAHGGQLWFDALALRVSGLVVQMGNDVKQCFGRVDRDVRDQRRLVAIVEREDEAARRLSSRGALGDRASHRERSKYRPQLARQRQFAGELESLQHARGRLTGCR